MTKIFRPALLAVLALSSISCFGARPYQPVFGDPMLEPWRWRTYPELNGLDALCMTEGADGTMWFGTANGLWSYDGIVWRWHSADGIVGHIVTAICQTNGNLYVGGGWGISQFSNGEWTRLLSASGNRISEVEDVPVRKLATSHDGSLWAATSWGALHRRQSTWTLYTDPDTAGKVRENQSLKLLNIEHLPETVIVRLRSSSLPANRCDLTEIVADRQGRMWFGTSGGEVLCYVSAPSSANAAAIQGTWSIYNKSDGLASGAITSILPLPQQDGTVWVVHAASEEASVFDGSTWQTVRLPLFLPALDTGDTGGKLLQTRDGVIWLLARYALYAYRDGHWRKYEQPEVSYPSTRNVVLQSADGALWFVGPNTEIHRVDYQTSRWFTLQNLNFQWESPAGVQWFLHRDGRIVVHETNQWTSFGVEDGLMDTPVALLGTRRGEVWAAGSHEQTAATARFDGQKWTRHLHENFAWGVDWRGVFESSDGSVWFSAFVDTDGPKQHRAGILQFREGVWLHHHQPGRSPRADGSEHPATLLPASSSPDRPIEKFFCLGESPDGKIWAGRNILAFHDGSNWEEFVPTSEIQLGIIEDMLPTREKELWIGTRGYGALRYDGHDWRQFHDKDGLVANSVRSLTQTTDGSIWAATDRGFSRFDGRSWMADVLPEALNFPYESGNVNASPSGRLWINRHTLYWMRRAWPKSPRPNPNAEFRTVSHHFRGEPPHTSITAGTEIISQPGNLAVLWSGVVPWREAKEARLQFSFRLDDEPWSAFTSDRGHSFFSLPAGQHQLAVRARDQDFNVDPTPAVLDFTVLPPVWQQAWFVSLMVVLAGLIVAQSTRVFRERARLRKANRVLAAEIQERHRAEEALRQLNLELDLRVKARTARLEAINRELEAFSYSVSHDLRAPLRAIDGYSKALLEDYTGTLAEEGQDYLRFIRAGAQRMGRLIDDMLSLARVTRDRMHMGKVDLSRLVAEIADTLARDEPGREVAFTIAPEIVVEGDARYLRLALENLLGNAWKFTSKRAVAKIEFGRMEQSGEMVYFVRDNGAGFDMEYAGHLFEAFRRLHTPEEFSGTGIGLATVHRIVRRHGGRVWAEGRVDGGATFFFTLEPQAAP